MTAGTKSRIEQPAWKALRGAHYDRVHTLHLRKLFADDHERGARMTAEAAGIYLDYAKNRITAETRFDVDLPRIMKVTPSGMRAGIVFATDPGQPAMQVNGVEISQNQIAKFGLDWDWYLRSSAPCK